MVFALNDLFFLIMFCINFLECLLLIIQFVLQSATKRGRSVDFEDSFCTDEDDSESSSFAATPKRRKKEKGVVSFIGGRDPDCIIYVHRQQTTFCESIFRKDVSLLPY